MRNIISFFILGFVTVSCAQMGQTTSADTENDLLKRGVENRDINLPSDSVLLDPDNRISLTDLLIGRNSTNFSVNQLTFNVALDKVSFMPLASVDAQSGIIVTDWYNLNNQSERIKINIRVTDEGMSDDSLQVNLFTQNYDGNKWNDLGVDKTQSAKIKKIILEEAQALKIASEL